MRVDPGPAAGDRRRGARAGGPGPAAAAAAVHRLQRPRRGRLGGKRPGDRQLSDEHRRVIIKKSLVRAAFQVPGHTYLYIQPELYLERIKPQRTHINKNECSCWFINRGIIVA